MALMVSLSLSSGFLAYTLVFAFERVSEKSEASFEVQSAFSRRCLTTADLEEFNGRKGFWPFSGGRYLRSEKRVYHLFTYSEGDSDVGRHNSLQNMVGDTGFEPVTSCLSSKILYLLSFFISDWERVFYDCNTKRHNNL